MKRKIITIIEDNCTGCGLCIPDCPEGALQLIDGKARLVSDLFCDGLGACVGVCPTGAMQVVEREAEPYDENKVMANIAKQGPAVITAHLLHLKDHGEDELFSQAVVYLNEHGLPVPVTGEKKSPMAGGCPGPDNMKIERNKEKGQNIDFDNQPSELQQWPVQLKLLNPAAPFFKNADLLIAADCVPFAYNAFHQNMLKDKIVIMFCPKLDNGLEQYVKRLAEIFKNQDINSITIVNMEVPCCNGTRVIVHNAMQKVGKNIPVEELTITIKGAIRK